ncbi:MAG: tripartite tricarboxylate transporter permease, partial [Nitrospinota bacterium]
MLDTLSEAIALTFRLDTFLLMAVGLYAGMFVGALPGLTATLAVAVLLPISFRIEPLLGIPFLIAITKGGIYGGSIPAILVNIPGTGAAIATTFDGNPLAKQGKARKALEMALFCSVIGDTASDIITILLIGFIAALALLIGPPELFAIVVFSLILIASVGVGTTIKGAISAVLGLLFAVVGHDPLSAASRFTFGIFELSKGIELLPMVIGLFAVPEILEALESKAATFVSERVDLKKGEERLTWAEFRACLRTIVRSIFIGTGIGAVPGVG